MKRNNNPENSLPIVGIGASAGGLNALRKFFSKVPADSGLAYVVVVHLSPDHKSMLAELLQPHVEIPVLQVMETIELKANHIYVIPPNANLNTIDTHLRLSELEQNRRERAPIDHFFRTLSETHDGNSIGVILTGTGSDGTIGLKEIKDRGGLSVVQDPAEAEYDGMPQSAISTGMVDLVLPLAEIPEHILRFAQTKPEIPVLQPGQKPDKDIRLLIQKVYAQVRARTGRDFTNYKLSTIMRRLQRRMQMVQIEQLDDYLEYLRQNPDEVHSLADDFLVNVTNFFRDTHVFEHLEKEIIPNLFKDRDPSEQVRVWSVGCATGEEAYSLAILLMETASQMEAPPSIQVFATDLHQQSLKKGREGFYPGDIKADVNPERLRRFFIKEDGGYRVRKELREMVIFTPHNLMGDPPFSRIDLLVCRNLLIYLKREIQKDIADLFHYALKKDSYLLLGTSESIEDLDLFKTIHKEFSVYQKKNIAGPEPKLPVFPRANIHFQPDAEKEHHDKDISTGALHYKMVERYGPPSLLVSLNFQILHISEHAGRYLAVSGGEVTRDLFKLIKPELQLELRTLIYKNKEKNKVSRSKLLPVTLEGEDRAVIISTRKIVDPDSQEVFLITFDEFDPDHFIISTELTTAEGTQREKEMERELQEHQQQLQAVIEEYETTHEEMKASNEELQSANEELRSTMEELETSKEELQSLNEELTTLNQENRHKVEELGQLSDDLQNLLSSTEIATLYLDRNFRILRFTPKLGELFNVRPADRGRPISDQTHKLGYDNLIEDAHKVLRNLQPLEKEVKDLNNNIYLTRILPYRSSEDKIEGVVITFIDITELKKAQEELTESESRFRALVNASSDVIYRMSPDWKEMNELKGMDFLADTKSTDPNWRQKYIHPDDLAFVDEAINKAIESKSVFELEHRVLKAGGELGWTYSRAVPLFDEKGNITEWFGAASDVTDRKKAEQNLKEAKDYAERIIETLHEPLLILHPDLTVKLANDAFYEHFQVNPEETKNTLVYELGNGQWNIPALRKLLDDVLPENNVFTDFEVEHNFEQLGPRTMILNARRLDHVQLILLGIRDITQRKKDEMLLRQSEERLKRMINVDGVGVLTFNEQYILIDCNSWFLNMVGYSKDEIIKNKLSWKDFTPPEYHEISRQQLEKSKSSGRIGPYEKEYLRKDGSRIWLTFAGASLGDGTIVEYCIDISDRKKAEQALQKNEERLRITMDAVEMGSWEVKDDKSIAYVDDKTIEMFDLEKGKHLIDLNKNIFEKIHPEDQEMVGRSIKKAWEESGEFNVELRIIVNDRERWIAGRGKVVQTNGHRRMSGVNFDITERKHIEEVLKHAKEEAERAAKAKEEFLAHMSHEIRTPLNAIVGLSHLLLQQEPKNEQLENLNTLKYSAETLHMLINDILDLSKIQAGKMSFVKEEINLQELMENTIHIHQTTALKKGLDLQLQQDNIPQYVLSDQLKLSQVLNNLLSNAIKFTHEGMVQLDVKLNKQEDNKAWIDFTVEDTGIGISEDKLNEIFNVFSQEDSSTAREYGGTGLGLTLVKMYLEMMESEIKLESTPGKGSRFYFTLPVEVSNGESLKKKDLAKSLTDDEIGNMKILLVEDADVNRMVIRQFLQEWWKLSSDEALDGKQAIEMAGNKKYDLILMDVRMPVMDGYDATRQIRALPGYENIKIIALTADVSNNVKDAVASTLFDDLIVKPVDPEQLQLKIIEHGGIQLDIKLPPKPDTAPSADTGLNLDKINALMKNDQATIDAFLQKTASEVDKMKEKFNKAFVEKDDKAMYDLQHKHKWTFELLYEENLHEHLLKCVELIKDNAPEDEMNEAQKKGNAMLDDFKEKLNKSKIFT